MTWNRNTDRVRRFKRDVDPKTVDWKAFLGNAREAAVRRVPLPELALVLGLRRRHLHRPDGPLDRRRPLGPRTSTTRRRRSASASTSSAKGVWETPDTVQTLLTYPGGVQMHFEGTFSNARDGAHIEFMGTEATLYVDRGRLRADPGARTRRRSRRRSILGRAGARGADFYDKPDGELLHLTNWVECIRSRKTPTAPAEAGVASAAAAHLANKALRNGGAATWSSEK